MDLRLPVDKKAPSAARLAVQRTLVDYLAPRAMQNLQLLVSELVTNSLRHADLPDDGWIEVEVSLSPQTIRVDVVDPGSGFEVSKSMQTRDNGPGGWGLLLVDRIARQWGVINDGVCRVWFEISSDDPFITAQ